GLLAFTEHLHSDELVFPKRVELANSDHNLGAAPSHTAANLDERNDVVCRRKELLQLGDRLLERIFEVFHKSSELLSTSIDPGLRMSRVCLPFEVRRDLREYAVPVSTIKCFNQAP